MNTPDPPVPVDLLIGRHRAAQFINSRVRALVCQDALSESLAYDLVCTAVLDSDPWVLADPGQTWVPGPHIDPDDAPAGIVYIARRDGVELLLEDEYGQRDWLQLNALNGYRLDQWLWAREDTLEPVLDGT